jgi:hypothetical protein
MTAVTIEELRQFDEAERRGRRSSPLSQIGLSVDEEGCACMEGDRTPLDSVIFGYTGGDSVHFCALTTDGLSSSQWPVVMVVPFCFDEARLAVGATLHEFLCLGAVGGYSPLEQLVYDRQNALSYLFDRGRYLDWCYPSPEAQQDWAGDIGESEETIARLTQRFGLVPWSTPAHRLAELQDLYGSRIRVGRAD